MLKTTQCCTLHTSGDQMFWNLQFMTTNKEMAHNNHIYILAIIFISSFFSFFFSPFASVNGTLIGKHTYFFDSYSLLHKLWTGELVWKMDGLNLVSVVCEEMDHLQGAWKRGLEQWKGHLYVLYLYSAFTPDKGTQGGFLVSHGIVYCCLQKQEGILPH